LSDPETIDLHPDARQNFDQRAHLLSTSLTTDPQAFDDSHRFPINPYVKAALTKEDIAPQESIWGRLDHAAQETARYFQAGDQVFGLEGDTYVAFRGLAESIQRARPLRDKVSLRTILDLLTLWLRAVRKGQAEASATEFVLTKCRDIVCEYTVLMPLYELYIEEPFEVGKVLIRTVTNEEIDGWVADWAGEHPDHIASYQQSGEKWKQALQGKAAASVALVAEPQRAYEVARREAEDALAMLRVFSLAMLMPEARSYWTLLGSERAEQYMYFVFLGGRLKNGHQGFYRYRHTVPTLNKGQIAYFRELGLDTASSLLRTEERNDLQESLLESLLIYSRAALQDDLAEKLLYIIVALETFLVRDTAEPLQQNLAERVAFAIGRSLTERKDIIKATKDAYGLRSRFMHHGAAVDDVKAMEEFMKYAFAFFITVLERANQFSSRTAFLDALEDRKLS
jgi:hypothetical protein